MSNPESSGCPLYKGKLSCDYEKVCHPERNRAMSESVLRAAEKYLAAGGTTETLAVIIEAAARELAMCKGEKP